MLVTDVGDQMCGDKFGTLAAYHMWQILELKR